MSKELLEIGLKLASPAFASSEYGTEWLDRTIYHTVYVTDPNGKILIDGKGDKVARNQVLFLACTYISKSQMEHALQVEKEFKELNDYFREAMTKDQINWRIPKSAQKAVIFDSIN
jgi:hypothetical protein